jgi:hypothetical protein
MGLPVGQDSSPLNSMLNISGATVAKVGGGFVYSLAVITGPCSIYDFAAASGQGAANLIWTSPTATGIYQLNFPFKLGLLVVPAGGTATVSFQ